MAEGRHRLHGGGRSRGSWRHREINEVGRLRDGEDPYEKKVWFPEFNTALKFLRLEDYDTVIRSGRIDEIRDDIIAHRRVWTFHQVEQELRRVAMEGRRGARATTATALGETAQIQALITRMDQQQRTIDGLVTLTRNLADMVTERERRGAAEDEPSAA